MRFERGPRTNTLDERRHEAASTGIGLAQARALVERHHGTIRAESAVGEGATFTVSLPTDRDAFEPDALASVVEKDTDAVIPENEDAGIARSTTAAATELSGSTAAATDRDDAEDRTTVLVVDDEPDMRSYLRRCLAAEYRVLEASDGRAALRRAAAHTPDLIIADVMMPDMDGLALARSVKEDPELDFVPIILLTAKGSRSTRLESLSLGIDDYVTKPFDRRELTSRVRNLIDGRRRLLARVRSASEVRLHLPAVDIVPADQDFLARVQSLIETHLEEPGFGVEALAEAPRLRPVVPLPQASRAGRRGALGPAPPFAPRTRRGPIAPACRLGRRRRVSGRLPQRLSFLASVSRALRHQPLRLGRPTSGRPGVGADPRVAVVRPPAIDPVAGIVAGDADNKTDTLGIAHDKVGPRNALAWAHIFHAGRRSNAVALSGERSIERTAQ